MTDEGQPQEVQTESRSSGFPLLLVTLAIVAVVMVVFNRVSQALQAECVNTIHETSPSPDGERSAVLFERNCGTDSGFSSQVAVVLAGNELPDRAGNAVVAVNDSAAGSAPWGGPAITMTWLDSEHLELRVEPAAILTSSSNAAAGVSISVRR